MLQLTNRALLLPPSGIREFMHKAYARTGVISLAAGEPNFPTPRHICDAAYQGALDGFTGYAPTPGLPTLRSLIAERVCRTTSLAATVDWVTVAAGGVQALFAAFGALAAKGEEILLPDPGWPNWEIAARLQEIEPVRYRLQAANGFMPDPQEIATLVTPRTRVLLVNSPNNPTGAV
jgi:aspartate aminotransferase